MTVFVFSKTIWKINSGPSRMTTTMLPWHKFLFPKGTTARGHHISQVSPSREPLCALEDGSIEAELIYLNCATLRCSVLF